mmetsp:Transcript_55175/g.159786  ORF Transcript_55175/g.159786 Transcript_55175/m.159786 type:complete len:251 (+) Transcript_55175:41-793(+)
MQGWRCAPCTSRARGRSLPSESVERAQCLLDLALALPRGRQHLLVRALLLDLLGAVLRHLGDAIVDHLSLLPQALAFVERLPVLIDLHLLDEVGAMGAAQLRVRWRLVLRTPIPSALRLAGLSLPPGLLLPLLHLRPHHLGVLPPLLSRSDLFIRPLRVADEDALMDLLPLEVAIFARRLQFGLGLQDLVLQGLADMPILQTARHMLRGPREKARMPLQVFRGLRVFRWRRDQTLRRRLLRGSPRAGGQR